jgi:AraC-like DNA-binding protein
VTLRKSAHGDGTPAFFSSQVAQFRRFYFDLNPPQRHLGVVCGGMEQCAADYAIHRAHFPYFCLEYVVGGRGELTLAGNNHALQAGQVFAYGPGTALDIASNPDDPLTKYFICFCGLKARAMLRSAKLTKGNLVRLFPSAALVPLFEEMIQAGQHGGRRGTDLCIELMKCLILKIVAAMAPPQGPDTASFATYLRCRRHIEAHFLRFSTLNKIAEECHVSEAYICRLFRSYEYVSPYQFLLRLKMHYAAGQLQQSDALIKQVAETVGFSDTLHFSRVFRRILGATPTTFRRVR